jgi:hypothetical protein
LPLEPPLPVYSKCANIIVTIVLQHFSQLWWIVRIFRWQCSTFMK